MRGPLLLLYDSNSDDLPDKIKVYCDAVKNCQGILALNGDVYVTADGPEGEALYRLSDRDRDGKLEDVRALITFNVEGEEHGAHGIVLGPDGMLYVVLGNHTQLPDSVSLRSPYYGFYEGDLVGPRYEDPGGHANGVGAPGGTILRTNLDGTEIDVVAGGLRNVYDLAFNRQGDLFVHDSDMESDMGMSWFRPTRLYHVLPGAEFGWRSGWAKWPKYFVDCLPEILDTGRGSPTGATFYNHFAFPRRYHNRLFLADWSQGQILAVELNNDGAGYKAKSEVFLEGQPLNVTDLEIGPKRGHVFCHRRPWDGRRTLSREVERESTRRRPRFGRRNHRRNSSTTRQQRVGTASNLRKPRTVSGLVGMPKSWVLLEASPTHGIIA